MAYKTSIISIKLEGELVAQQISVNVTVRSSKNPQQTCDVRLRWAVSCCCGRSLSSNSRPSGLAKKSLGQGGGSVASGHANQFSKKLKNPPEGQLCGTLPKCHFTPLKKTGIWQAHLEFTKRYFLQTNETKIEFSCLESKAFLLAKDRCC